MGSGGAEGEQGGGGSTREAARGLVAAGLDGVGGFSLILGRLRRPDWQHQRQGATAPDGRGAAPPAANGDAPPRRGAPPAWEGLAVVSNRALADGGPDGVAWLCRGAGETHALSNARYAASPPWWPKVRAARDLVAAAARDSAAAGEGAAALRRRLLAVLARDTLPRRPAGEAWEGYVDKLRESIFVPAVNQEDPTARAVDGRGAAAGRAANGAYGTQKQSVVLVDWEGNVSFFERTLFDERGAPVAVGEGDREFGFRVEGWDGGPD
jgi:hypothetical protein